MTSLLDPAFVRELERLKVELRRRLDGPHAGERRGLRRGAGVEYAGHRPYAPGDDLRRVDWNAFARLRELVFRTTLPDTDATVHLVLDASRSMAFGEPSKLRVACRLAAAIGYLCLTGSERVGLHVEAGEGSAPRPPWRGRARVPSLLAALEALRPAGAASLARAAGALKGARGGLAVCFTDGLDEGAEAAVGRLAATGLECCLVQVLSDEELSPAFDGDLELVDSESGETLRLSVDEGVASELHARVRALSEALEGQCRRRGVRYVGAFGGAEALSVLARVLGA
ncbi:MAG: DUF58 domain-containing protein [Deltaproteobacteria bacterium]|nr:DUF58 domain-containing protein [Deltaproteobacteria bacterium]